MSAMKPDTGVHDTTTTRPQGILGTVVHGVLWSSGAQVGRQVLQLVTVTILARLLLPSHFGVLAMVAVINGFATLFVEMGFGAALIQRPDLGERHSTSVFWITTGVGALFAILLAAAAPVVATFYEEPVLRPVTRVLSLQLFTAGLGVVPRALLVRAHDFRGIAVVELWATAVSSGVAWSLAFAGAGIWALVAQTLVATGVSTAGYFRRLRTWRPRLSYSREAIRQLLGFSANLLGFNVVNFWARNADNLLVGRFLGSAQLGAYALSYQIMLLPIQHIPQVFGQVMFPVLSELQHTPERARQAYGRAVQVIALFAFPLMTGLCIAAPELASVFFGEQWARAGRLVRILAIAGLAQTVGVTIAWIWQAKGRTDVMFRWGLFASVATILSIVIGLRWQVEGVAVSYTACILILTPLSLHIAGALIGVTLMDFARMVAPAACGALAMAVTGSVVRGLLATTSSSAWVVLAATIASAAMAYVIGVWATGTDWSRELRQVIAARRSGHVGGEGTGADVRDGSPVGAMHASGPAGRGGCDGS